MGTDHALIFGTKKRDCPLYRVDPEHLFPPLFTLRSGVLGESPGGSSSREEPRYHARGIAALFILSEIGAADGFSPKCKPAL